MRKALIAILSAAMLLPLAVSCNSDASEGIYHLVTKSSAAMTYDTTTRVAGLTSDGIAYLTDTGLWNYKDGVASVIRSNDEGSIRSVCLDSGVPVILLSNGQLLKQNASSWDVVEENGVSTLYSNGYYLKADGTLKVLGSSDPVSSENVIYCRESGDYILAVSSEKEEIISSSEHYTIEMDYENWVGFQTIGSGMFLAIGPKSNDYKVWLVKCEAATMTFTQVAGTASAFVSSISQAASFLYEKDGKTYAAFKTFSYFEEYDVTTADDVATIKRSAKSDGYADTLRNADVISNIVPYDSPSRFLASAWETGLVLIDTAAGKSEVLH